ncbi:DUF1573 domain-containing protein [Fluviicola sp.]|jgi:hypothetical protein|uniref:DUF1573 domain-containing protein n=1 Tax=Fluviicola sp. TaxID=1917219 RepID=UPI0028348CD8|nr:DUF1573 domain-containing protein [Fluviicola sp.]MDR0801178.1 DUF1573 domain-containing protein [Fluviicola sp.]
MKVIAILAVSFISLGTFAQTTEKKESPKKEMEEKAPVVFKTLKIERAEIPYDSKEPFIFEFKNNGKTPLIITNVQTSCGCTAAEKPTEPIEKGKSSKIVVNYDTKRVGQFTKTITVTTNASTEPIILTITGKVLPQEAAPATN